METSMPQQPNPAAFDFLANRKSRPAKLMTGPVPDRTTLLNILQVALRVPDHGKLEPWRLVVVDRTAMARLADMAEARATELGADAEKTAKGRGQFDKGQLAVVVISSPKPSDKVPVVEQVLSAGALCFGIVTAAEAAGWASCWLSGWPSHDRGFIEAAFGCAPHETVAGIVHVATFNGKTMDRPRPDPGALITWGIP
jgi:nitroreductase